MKKVLLLEPVSDMGGVTQYIRHIVEFIEASDIELYFAASPGGEAFAVLSKLGVHTYELPLEYTLKTARKTMHALRALIQAQGIDIVHAHTAKAGLIAIAATRRLPVRVIYTGHGWRFLQKKGIARAYMYLCERYITSHADQVTLLSQKEYTQGMRAHLLQNNTSIIPYSLPTSLSLSVDMRHKYNIPSSAVVITMLGRITHQKDPETFGKVIEKMVKETPDVYAVWIGDGEERDTLLCAVGSAKDKLIITGFIEQAMVHSMLLQSTVMVFTSRYEGLPISLLEAGLAGLPVVAADVGSVSEVIVDGKTGLLYHTENIPAAYQKLRCLLEDPTAAQEYGRALKALVQKDYTPEQKTAQCFSLLYRTL